MLEHVKNSPDGFETMIREGIFASDQNNVNPLPPEPLRVPPSSSAPSTSVAPPAAPLPSIPPAAEVQPTSFPLISPAETPSNHGPGDRTVTAQRVDIEFPRFGTAVQATPPVLDVNQAGGSSGAGGVSSSPVRPRMSDLRFLFSLDAMTANNDSGAAQPAPLSSIPVEEGARLIPPIIPTSAPLNSSLPTEISQRQGGGIPSAPANEFAPPPASGSSAPSQNSTSSTAAPNNAGSTTNVNRICRDCAFELFLHELYPWWCRERARVLTLMKSHPIPATSAAAPDQETSSANPISDAAARANIDLLVASSGLATSANELLLDDAEGAGEDDSDDEGYNGDGSADRRGDIVVSGGNGDTPSLQRLTSRLPEWVGSRPNCPDGRRCDRQKEMSHAKDCACNWCR